MPQVLIHAGPQRYPFILDHGWGKFAAHFKKIGHGSQVVIVTHAMLRRRHGAALETICERSGRKVRWLLVPQGERSKLAACVEKIYARLAQWRVDRDTVLMSFGGGVVGDVGGFVAATFLRGLPWIVLPTSLVAMCDSSIGGKVGVNTRAGKNLVGAFYQPQLVVANLDLLRTLPVAGWRDGLAEALKCGLLADPKLVPLVSCALPQPKNIADVILRAARVKARIIARDVDDRRGVRCWLNLGHTVGHALERFGHYRTWSHGAAVGCGLVAAARLSQRWGYASTNLVNLVTATVTQLGLPTALPRLSVARWETLLAAEKKRRGQSIQFVALRAVGRPVIHHISITQLAQHLVDVGRG